MLAMLAALGMTDIHAMNALKSVMGFVINGVAVVIFVVERAVYWRHGLVMIAGGIMGGYLGAHYAQKMPQAWIRMFVVLVGAGDDRVFLLEVVLKRKATDSTDFHGSRAEELHLIRDESV